MGQAIYLDWRPVPVDAIRECVLQSKVLDLDNKSDLSLIEGIQKKFFPKKYYFPIYLRENYKRIWYQSRTDGLFAFSFEKRGGNDYSTEAELAQFASYFIKSLLGHTHDNDQSHFDISRSAKSEKITYRRITNSPVKVAEQFDDGWRFYVSKPRSGLSPEIRKRIDTSLAYAISSKGLTSNISLGEDNSLECKLLAVLRIKINFASMFDLTELATQGMTASRQPVTYLSVILGMYCSMLIANAVGYISIHGTPTTNFWIGHPLAILIVVPALYSVFSRVIYKPYIKHKLASFLDDHFKKQSISESYDFLAHRFHKPFSRYIFNRGLPNNLILGVFISLLVFVFFKGAWDWLLGHMGIPAHKIGREIWDIDQAYYASTDGIRVLCFAMILITCMNYIPKIWRYRSTKFNAWKICFGYLTYGNVYCQVIENIFYSEKRRRAVGFINGAEIASSKMRYELYKYILDCLILFVLASVPFVTIAFY